jgi:hypothetical protein
MSPADPTNMNWITQPNEDVTIAETHTQTMPGVNFTLDSASLPTPAASFRMGAAGTRTFTVTAHFSGTLGETCNIQVAGSAGGAATKIIRQPSSSSFDQRSFTFTVENE